MSKGGSVCDETGLTSLNPKHPVGYVDVTALIEKVATDLAIAQNWKPGTLKDDGKRSGAEKGFRE